MDSVVYTPSVTATLNTNRLGPWASVGVQANTPVVESIVAPGGATDRPKESVSAGSGSDAAAVISQAWPSLKLAGWERGRGGTRAGGCVRRLAAVRRHSPAARVEAAGRVREQVGGSERVGGPKNVALTVAPSV